MATAAEHPVPEPKLVAPFMTVEPVTVTWYEDDLVDGDLVPTGTRTVEGTISWAADSGPLATYPIIVLEPTDPEAGFERVSLSSLLRLAWHGQVTEFRSQATAADMDAYDQPATAGVRLDLLTAATAVARDPSIIGATEDATARLFRLGLAATAAEGYDAPDQTHRRLVRLLEWVTGTLADLDSAADDDDPHREDLNYVEDRLTKIIRDMPANRTREGS